MKRKYKGIKKELVTFTIGCIICIVFILSVGSIYQTYHTTRKSLAKSLKETSELVSEKNNSEAGRVFHHIRVNCPLYEGECAKRRQHQYIFTDLMFPVRP